MELIFTLLILALVVILPLVKQPRPNPAAPGKLRQHRSTPLSSGHAISGEQRRTQSSDTAGLTGILKKYGHREGRLPLNRAIKHERTTCAQATSPRHSWADTLLGGTKVLARSATDSTRSSLSANSTSVLNFSPVLKNHPSLKNKHEL